MGILDRLMKAADSASGLNIIPGADPTAGCDITCGARILGIADLPAHGGPDDLEHQVSLLRLAVERPDGHYEACVRQDIPLSLQPTLVPGDRVIVRSHAVERGRTYVMWGNGPSGTSIIEKSLLRWPEHDRWPNINALEVYRKGDKRDPRLPVWRSERHTVTGSLADGHRTSMRMNGREVHELVVGTPQGPVTVKSQVPALALARLLVRHTQLRVGAPIVLLISSNHREIDVDWEATIAQPDNWRGGTD